MDLIVSQALPPRYWAKVEKTGTCWNWVAGKTSNGYGLFKFDGTTQVAHRLAYVATHGPIPKGMQIDHMCHNRGCVRPDHLRVVTAKQNKEHRRGAQVNSKSGVRGVYWNKARGKWVAQVRHDGRPLYLGSFDTVEEAEAAATAKRLALFTHNDADRIAA